MHQALLSACRFEANHSVGVRHLQHTAQFRPEFTHTSRAHCRARKLGLNVNIQLALKCPQRHVSAVPLPILDRTESPTASFLSLSPLTPFFLPSDSFQWTSTTAPQQLPSRFSVSPVSPTDIPFFDSPEFAPEVIQNFRTTTRQDLPELPMNERDDAWECDMSPPDVDMSPDSLSLNPSPMSTKSCHFAYPSPKHLMRERWAQYVAPVSIISFPTHF